MLTGAAIAVHRAETAPVPVPAPRHEVEPTRDLGPRFDPRDDLLERVAAAPANRMPELIAALVAGIDVDDSPTIEPYAMEPPIVMSIPVTRNFKSDLGSTSDEQGDSYGTSLSSAGAEHPDDIDGEGDVEAMSDR